MHKNILVKFTLQITCQWMEIDRYKLSALYAHFTVHREMDDFLVFFTPKPFLSYLPCFSLFRTNFFLKTGVYMEK